jgi:class 3 adenylate cyclase
MSGHVLVVDDDPEVLRIMVDMLEADGCLVLSATDPERALRLLDALAVDVVVSDVMMPGLNGLQVLALARKRNPTVEVVLVTGYGSREVAAAASEAGAYACLEKPLDFDRLVQTVRAARQRRGGPPGGFEPDGPPSAPTGRPRSAYRRLTAILSADVEGYSRLMGEDEIATVARLSVYREIMTTLIVQHAGRVVDMAGDNLLAEFPSAVDAVRCGVAVQQRLRVANARLPANRRMRMRIGINVGDILVEEGRIYGDAVNVAARLEGLAEGGGICISGILYDLVRTKLAVGFEPLGEHTVKNIADPVRVYRVPVEPAGSGVAPSEPGEAAPAPGSLPLMVVN